MKEILCSNGVVKVSDEDFSYLNQFSWCIGGRGENDYQINRLPQTFGGIR